MSQLQLNVTDEELSKAWHTLFVRDERPNEVINTASDAYVIGATKLGHNVSTCNSHKCDQLF